MMKKHILLTTALLSSAAIAACSAEPETKVQPADSFLTASGIYSGNNATADIEAIAIADGEIICAASILACEPHIDGGTNQIDVDGYIYPGFVDGHAHLLGIGQRELTLNLEGTKSVVELQDRVRAYKDNASGELSVIYGRGWIETHWPEGRFPNRQDLDAVSSDIPIILTRADGHAAVVNTKALELSGITADTPDPFGGAINKDEDGEPNGMLIDTAEALVSDLLPKDSPEARRTAYIKAGEVYSAMGWTGLHNMSVDPNDVSIMQSLSDDAQMPLRIYNALNYEGAAPDVLSADDRIPTKLVTTRAVKLYVDGALGSRGAALLEPYSDDPGNRGLVLIEKDQAVEIFKTGLREGFQINTHAIGDRGNRILLDWYEEAFAAVPESERAIPKPRWRIEHAQILDTADIERFAALGIIPSMQPSHAIGDLHFAVDRLGVERLRGGYAWRDLIDSGVIIVGGSDAPVEKGDPRIEFYAAIARKDASGYSGEGWYPEQAVTRHEALKMLTQWPAYGAFVEDHVGTIEMGKRADLTILGSDIMTIPEDQILGVKVLGTVIDGDVNLND